MKAGTERLKKLLDEKTAVYNRPAFIAGDPISVPHRFSRKQDIEISGLFAAVLAWGNRTMIIRNSSRLMERMDNAPYDFIRDHSEAELKPFLSFVHRTFNATDLLYFISFLKKHYGKSGSLEDAFVRENAYEEETVEKALLHFHDYFFRDEHPRRTEKHIATPARKSACKRLNMFLRWMVRKDRHGVDFGIWNKIKMHQLICPLDLHVARVAHRLGLLPDERSSWKNATHLTRRLKEFNPADPVVYDFGLFGLGMAERL